MSKTTMKPVAAAIGAAFVGSMMLAGSASAASNPFGLSELNGGYAQIAGNEGKCGGSMSTDKPAEGKCGGSMSTDKPAEGKCGAGKC
ncbi:MAG: low-complexity protein, partial [Sedimenticolaceae bacterium]